MEFLTIAQSTQQIKTGQHVLGGICHTDIDTAGTLLHLPLPLLEGKDCLQELFLTNLTPAKNEILIPNGKICYSKTSEFIFGHIDIEQDFPTQNMKEASLHAYRAMLQLCQDVKLPNILRIWNFIPHINAPESEIERYHLFSAGRWQAFNEYQQTINHGCPAACALGSFSNTISIAFLASTKKPLSIENPRQISAYFYPKQYGSAPPVFSRAALFHQHSESTLFISGTASIIGHASCHENDIQAQTHETIRNLSILLTQVNSLEKKERTDLQKPWQLSELYCRIYVRHPEHLKTIQNILRHSDIKQAVYLQADICRAELLLEIEATAHHIHRKFKNRAAA